MHIDRCCSLQSIIVQAIIKITSIILTQVAHTIKWSGKEWHFSLRPPLQAWHSLQWASEPRLVELFVPLVDMFSATLRLTKSLLLSISFTWSCNWANSQSRAAFLSDGDSGLSFCPTLLPCSHAVLCLKMWLARCSFAWLLRARWHWVL